MRKKTHEEYVAELAIKNPNIEVIGKYINTNTKILHKCLIHNIYWELKPSSALQGCGCRICKKEKFHKSNTKTHEQYVEEIKKVSPNIEVIEKYIGAKTPIKHYCKKHNILWNPLPTNVLKGNGCVECGKEKIVEKNRKTHEQYIQELNLANPKIKVIDTYIDSFTPILHKCLIDGYEWYTAPANILSAKGCPKCSGNIKKTQEEYIEEVENINPNIEVMDEYINMKTPILHKCKIHNIQWITSPSSILQGCGCQKCGKEKLYVNKAKTHEEYIKELKRINKNIIPIGKYINSITPILHKCLIDNYEWNARPGNVLLGNGCPKCNNSKGETQVCLWLDNHHIIYESQKKFKDCCDIKPLPFDFYLPNHNIAIEYDGEQHYRPVKYFGGNNAFNRTIKHDRIKNEYCKNNGISLLRIPYYKNVEEELNNFLFI